MEHVHGDHDRMQEPDAAMTVKDPVCGMSVNPDKTTHHADHSGTTYYFCSAGCRTSFVARPEQYLVRPAPPEATPGTIWTCPMHPQIRQDHSGNCPICGMALEPAMVTAEGGSSPELLDMTRRFWIALVLALPVFVLEMGGHVFPALYHLVPMRMSSWIELVLATPVVLWAGWPFFQRGWMSLRTRNLNMFTLIAMGTGVAWSYSMVATLARSSFPPPFAPPTVRSRFISRRRQ
jgi:Cu+-exporting ATPase